MLFKNVSIAGLAHIDAPHTLTSDEINARLQPTLDRLGIKTDVLNDIAGVHSRRLWDADVQASDAATLAARKALLDAGIGADKIGLVVNTSVSRDYLEPSTASIVCGNLGVGDECQTFDVANACLAFINGMDIAARMMARRELAPEAPRYKGGVTRSATEWNKLCRGNLDRMVTDTRMLLIEGMKLANKTFAAAKVALGWAVDELDQFVIHQVSRPHTQAFIKSFGIDPQKVMTIFTEHGNIGPASVPIVLSKLKELGKLKKGDRIALLGIGSGLNCSMAEVEW